MLTILQHFAGALLASDLGAATVVTAKTDRIEEITVSAERLPIVGIGQSTDTLNPRLDTSLRLDDSLGQVPGISLFRRANSLTAHPTTQGLSARGVGANGAGRVLVTLDGAPLNNPFGGWVYWSSLNQREIARVDVLQGGSASAFGPQALAGTVSLSSVIPKESGGYLATEYGAFNSHSLSGAANLVGDKGYFRVSGSRFDSNGAFLLNPEQRGPVDVRAASQAHNINLRGTAQLWNGTDGHFSLRHYQEERTNGLSSAVNHTDGLDSSVRLVHRDDNGPDWELLGYYRTTDFSNVFSSARDNRTTERPVLDQFDVPGSGGGMLARVQFDGFEIGVEGRYVSGETNERFRNLGQGFTRLRVAGGEQRILGVFADYHRHTDWGALSLSSRVDRYRTFDGKRVETDLQSGTELRRDDVPSRSATEFSGRAGLRYNVSTAIAFDAAAYRSWRLPTINEFYRPFRVVNDITEANPNLLPEKLYGVEAGFIFESTDAAARMRLGYYRNWLEDGVGNLTVGFGPGFFPLGGFVPTGGVLRQRANIDRTLIDGIELDGTFNITAAREFIVRYLYTNSRISRFDANPSLIGNRPVQTPQHRVFAALRQNHSRGWLMLQARFSSSQFDDDLNERALPSVLTANVAATYRVSNTLTLSAAAENLFNRQVISAVTATGLETLAQQRFWRIGLEVRF